MFKIDLNFMGNISISTRSKKSLVILRWNKTRGTLTSRLSDEKNHFYDWDKRKLNGYYLYFY